ncbi:unnamed protein product [Scytosiphon promiscuus]
MNKLSSRSHTIVQLTVSNTRPARARFGALTTTRAKLSLVDLAGSERGTAVECREARERERSRINTSLSALSNCISCLGEARRRHVPFRDSPLTR